MRRDADFREIPRSAGFVPKPPIIIPTLCPIRTEEDQQAAWPVAARLVRHLTSFAAGADLIASLIFVRSFSSVDGTGVLHHSTGAALLIS